MWRDGGFGYYSMAVEVDAWDLVLWKSVECLVVGEDCRIWELVGDNGGLGYKQCLGNKSKTLWLLLYRSSMKLTCPCHSFHSNICKQLHSALPCLPK